MARRCAVTGATGLLGSHLVEMLVERGDAVRALVRPGSDTRFLERLGVDLCPGALEDGTSLLRLVDEAEVVYHCASRVGDWGNWDSFFRPVVLGTANLLKASEVAAVGRFLYVSTIGVYGHLRERADLFTESEPLGQNLWWWDYYRRAKILAEERVRIYAGDWTIVRPSWTYGPRDRNTVPRVVAALKARRAPLVGSGKNLLNLLYVADVAEGVHRAGTSPNAVGQTYNLASAGEVRQVDFANTMTDEMGLPRIRWRFPYGLSLWIGFCAEAWGRLWGWQKPPALTRYAVALIGRSVRFSIEKARAELGWVPRVGIQEGVRRTIAWLNEQEGAAK